MASVIISQSDAMGLAIELLMARGAPLEHARLQAKVLVDAELKGHPSHGLQRLPRLLLRLERKLADPNATGAVYSESGACLNIDGKNGLGPVVAFSAISSILPKARLQGIAMAAIRNANHMGMLASYVEEIARAGMIGIAMSSSEALVHPHGGTEALLGTNPLAMGVPVDGGPPLVVDLATSIVSMGKIHHHAATGKPLQSGWAKDGEGHATTDASLAKAGAIAPFGGAKGYALGFALEILIASIAGTPPAPQIKGTLDAENACNKGDVFILIDQKRQAQTAGMISKYLTLVRNSPPEDSKAPVRIPGDGARMRHARASITGFEIDSSLHAQLRSLSRSTRQNAS